MLLQDALRADAVRTCSSRVFGHMIVHWEVHAKTLLSVRILVRHSSKAPAEMIQLVSLCKLSTYKCVTLNVIAS